MVNNKKNKKCFSSERGELADISKSEGIARIYVLASLMLIVMLVIVLRLYSLQVAAHESYRVLADDQHSIFRKLVPKRGEIFLQDKTGRYPVAVNKETKMAYAVPKEIEDARWASVFLSETLGLDRKELEEKLAQKEDMYEVLKRRLSDEEISKISDSQIKGIHLIEEDYRYYPAGELASHALGFVGWSEEKFGGRYGLELSFEDQLKGQEGDIFQNKDASGRWISTGERSVRYAKDGDTLVLTIDHIVQYETEKILKAVMNKHEADRGSIIVMEAGTGKILSMASSPNFNPNEYGKIENMEAFRNLNISDAYESGSVFKTFTLAAAIDSNKISAETTYVDNGVVNEAGYSIKNSDYKAYGKQTMTQVLENSLNTGVIHAEKLMGNKNFADYVRRFGFGEPTGIELFGEAAGNIRNLNNLKSDIQFFTASFGQGITMTPLQLASAYNAIASGGVLMKPQIVEKIIHNDGSEETLEPKEIRRAITQQAAHETAKMLRSVVVNGHGKRANVPGYLVGGKTGTAQVASTEAKGYEEGKNIGSFAGFAPTDDPRFTIVVRIDNPKGVEWAESSAAPAFGELMKFLLEYYNVEPTEEYTQEDLDKFNKEHDLKEYLTKKEEDEENNNEKPSDVETENIKETNSKKKKDD